MHLNNLRSAPGARSKRKRVGRGPGSGMGKTSGRGHKGQKSRSGYSRRNGFEGGQMPLARRLPKRGFRHQKRHPVAIVNIDTLERLFDDGAEITSVAILTARLADDVPGGIKILARGEVTKKFSLKVQACSPSAKAKIEAVGGSVEIVAPAHLCKAEAEATVEITEE